MPWMDGNTPLACSLHMHAREAVLKHALAPTYVADMRTTKTRTQPASLKEHPTDRVRSMPQPTPLRGDPVDILPGDATIPDAGQILPGRYTQRKSRSPIDSNRSTMPPKSTPRKTPAWADEADLPDAGMGSPPPGLPARHAATAIVPGARGAHGPKALDLNRDWKQFVYKWSDKTHEVHKEAEKVASSIRKKFAPLGTKVGEAWDDLRYQHQEVVGRMAMTRRLAVVDALRAKAGGDDLFSAKDMPLYTGLDGLIVRHEMTEDSQRYISTLFVPFRGPGDFSDWKQALAAPSGSQWLLSKLTQTYVHAGERNSEPNTTHIIRSGVTDKLKELCTRFQTQDALYGMNSESDDTGERHCKEATHARELLLKNIEKNHRFESLFKALSGTIRIDGGSHHVLLHYGTCSPTKHTLVSYVLGQSPHGQAVFQGEYATTFKAHPQWQEETLCIPRLLSALDHAGDRGRVVSALGSYAHMAKEGLTRGGEGPTEMKQTTEALEAACNAIFIPRQDTSSHFTSKPGYQAHLGHAFSTYAFLTPDAPTLSDCAVYVVLSMLIPPVEQPPVYTMQDAPSSPDALPWYLLSDHKRALCLDPVTTGYYQAHLDKCPYMIFRDVGGHPFKVQLRIRPDKTVIPTVRFHQKLNGHESKSTRGILHRILRGECDKNEVETHESITRRANPRFYTAQIGVSKPRDGTIGKCPVPMFHDLKGSHVAQSAHRGYKSQTRAQFQLGAPMLAGGSTTLLPPNPRRREQGLGVAARNVPGSDQQAMNTLIVDLADIKRFISSMLAT